MSSLQLDSSSQIIPEPQKLPQALVEKCAAISVRPNAIKDLIDAMQCKLMFQHVFVVYNVALNYECCIVVKQYIVSLC